MIKSKSFQEWTTSAYDEACKMQFKGKKVLYVTLSKGRTDVRFMMMDGHDRENVVNG
jgi:hypothetical protein